MIDAVFHAVSDQANAWVNVFASWVHVLPFSFAFGAGMLATVNPCGFIMLPSFAAFYLATDGEETPALTRRLVRALQVGVLVTIAFVASFGLAGLVVTAGGRGIVRWSGWAGLGVGGLLVALGLYQLVTRRAVFAGVTASVRVSRSRTLRGVLAFGVAYAVASLGCTLPIFLLVVGSVFTGSNGYLGSAWRFVEYAAGMGMVLTLLTVGVAVARAPVVRFVSGVLPYVHGVANLALVFAGSYLVWYWWRALI
ncbi:MAG: cytochrome c biogenesis protein CcdA [Dehalococcoidia bacterium]|nr:MAG: cytochrome c biogenesis protein CcdA [Dehalococcoidia bacterium]